MKLSGFEVKNERSYTSAALICLHEVGWSIFSCLTYLFYVCVCVFTELEVGWCMVTYKNDKFLSDYKKNSDIGL